MTAQSIDKCHKMCFFPQIYPLCTLKNKIKIFFYKNIVCLRKCLFNLIKSIEKKLQQCFNIPQH